MYPDALAVPTGADQANCQHGCSTFPSIKHAAAGPLLTCPLSLSLLPRSWQEAPLPPHNWTAFMESKRKELQRLNNAYKNTLKNAGVELIEGRGKVVGPHEVEVDGNRFTVGGGG